MKILYGVQATGNGHITRARALASVLKAKGIHVTYLFSGRDPKDFFDMEVFGDYVVKAGLSFTAKNGKMDLFNTLKKANIAQLWRDVEALDLSEYDLVVSDFEPIVAWACRRQGVECIGIGHQYAFAYNIPKHQNRLGDFLLNWFAPATKKVGVHWHHFNQPILPPIFVDHKNENAMVQSKQVLVYLPFEDSKEVLEMLQAVPSYEFRMHCKDLEARKVGNVEIFPFSRAGFQQNLNECESVLCNAGFELNSEALHLGRRILVKPLQNQVEQHSNAVALEVLGYAQSTSRLTPLIIEHWLSTQKVVEVKYPNVALVLGEWLSEGAYRSVESLADELWGEPTNKMTREFGVPVVGI